MLPFKKPRVTFKKPSVKLGNLLLVPTIEKPGDQGETPEHRNLEAERCAMFCLGLACLFLGIVAIIIQFARGH